MNPTSLTETPCSCKSWCASFCTCVSIRQSRRPDGWTKTLVESQMHIHASTCNESIRPSYQTGPDRTDRPIIQQHALPMSSCIARFVLLLAFLLANISLFHFFCEHFLLLDQPVCPSAQFGWTGPNMLKHRLQQWREKWDNVQGLARDSPRRNSPRCSPPRRNSPHQRERHPRSRSRRGRQSRNGTVTHRTLVHHIVVVCFGGECNFVYLEKQMRCVVGQRRANGGCALNAG